MANIRGKSGSSVSILPGNRFYFLGLQNHCGWWLQPWNLKKLAPWKESCDEPEHHIKKQAHHFANKGKSYGFSSSHTHTWELDHKEDWVLKNWCLWTVLLEKTLESPLDSKEIKPVNPKEINPEYSLEGLMLKLKLQYFGHWMWRANSLEKKPWCWERLKAKGEEGVRGWDCYIASMGMNLSRLLEIVKDMEAWSTAVHGVTKSQTQLSDWKTIAKWLYV